jgi:5'-nucleotidase
MTLILTNDDGIDAPGIRALQSAIALEAKVSNPKPFIPKPFILVAPLHPHSGCGHQVTTQQPIAIQRRSPQEYAVVGTPADCARLGLIHLAPQATWVLSGINAGGNLGVDVYLSGTVAAVREAAMHGIPGIALSHWIRRPQSIDWEVASRWAAQVIALLWEQPLPKGSFWNVNLPHLPPNSPDPPIIFCKPSIHPLPVQYRIEDDVFYYRGEYSERDRAPGTDVDVCFSGNIAVTQIAL